jgi:hypothetical protein
VQNDPLLRNLVVSTNHVQNTFFNAAQYNALPPISNAAALMEHFHGVLVGQGMDEKEARLRAAHMALEQIQQETQAFNQILEHKRDIQQAEAAVNYKRLEVEQEARRLKHLSSTERARNWMSYVHLLFSTILSGISGAAVWFGSNNFLEPFKQLAQCLATSHTAYQMATGGGGLWGALAMVVNPAMSLLFAAKNLVGGFLGPALTGVTTMADGVKILASGSVFTLVFIMVYLMLRIFHSKKFSITGLVNLQMF